MRAWQQVVRNCKSDGVQTWTLQVSHRCWFCGGFPPLFPSLIISCPRYFCGSMGFLLELGAICLLPAPCQTQERVVEQHCPSPDMVIYLEKANLSQPEQWPESPSVLCGGATDLPAGASLGDVSPDRGCGTGPGCGGSCGHRGARRSGLLLPPWSSRVLPLPRCAQGSHDISCAPRARGSSGVSVPRQRAFPHPRAPK